MQKIISSYHHLMYSLISEYFKLKINSFLIYLKMTDFNNFMLVNILSILVMLFMVFNSIYHHHSLMILQYLMNLLFYSIF